MNVVSMGFMLNPNAMSAAQKPKPVERFRMSEPATEPSSLRGCVSVSNNDLAYDFTRGRYLLAIFLRTEGIAMITLIARATTAIAIISVFVGIMPERVLRPVKMPMSSSRTTVITPCTASTALMMAVAVVLR